jgi:uncharacterized membrane protein
MFDDYPGKKRALWLGTLIFSVLVVADQWFRWATFQYASFDIAFYTQAMWLALQGEGHVSLLNVPLMGNHAEPIAFLLLPFFWLWPHPMTLVIVQTLALATMPFTGARIARMLEFSPRAATWLGLAVVVFPATGYVALHEFHPEALAAPLLLGMLEARVAQRPGRFCVLFLLALACKENVALLLVWWCAVMWVLDRGRGREWRLAFNVVPGSIALAWLLIYSLWIGPKLNGGRVDYGELYSHLGGNGGEIVKNFFSEPSLALKAMTKALKDGNLGWGTLLPLALLPLFRARWLLITVPIFAQHLLSWRRSEWTIYFHYAAPLIPLLWFGAAEAAARRFWRDSLAGWVLAACTICQLWFGPVHSLVATARGAGDALWAREWKATMLGLIPADARVSAGMPYLSHLAKRRELHSLHHILKGTETLSRRRYSPPEVDAVVVDRDDDSTFSTEARYYHEAFFLRGTPPIPVEASPYLLHRFLSQSAWRVLARNAFTLYLKGGVAPEPAATGGGRKLDAHHSLASAQLIHVKETGVRMLILDWEIQPGRKDLLASELFLADEQEIAHLRETKTNPQTTLPRGISVRVARGLVAPGIESGAYREAVAIAPPPSLPEKKYWAVLLVTDDFKDKRGDGFVPQSFEVGEFGQ